MRLLFSNAAPTATRRRYSHRADRLRAVSATKPPRGISASTSESPRPWPISRSVDGKTASSATCTARAVTPSSSTPTKKWSSNAGPKTTPANSKPAFVVAGLQTGAFGVREPSSRFLGLIQPRSDPAAAPMPHAGRNRSRLFLYFVTSLLHLSSSWYRGRRRHSERSEESLCSLLSALCSLLNSPNPKTYTKPPQTAKTTASRCTSPAARPETESPRTDSHRVRSELPPRFFVPAALPSPRHAPRSPPKNTFHPSFLHAA